LERFNREVNLAIRITHPNVCRIYDLFHHGELSFLTMQLLEGETLHHRIQNTGPLNESKAFPIIEQLAEALSAAHNLGIIHRDLKPTNVMLVSKDSSDHVVLTDFGMAVAFAETRLTGDGQFLGTPEYMAPEQLRGENVSPATDVYALGLLMYEMVTGKQPFPGDSPYTIISSRLRSQIVSPRKINRGLSRTWEKTILRCFELDPKDRIQTPTDVIVALNNLPSNVPSETSSLSGFLSPIMKMAALRFVPEVVQRSTLFVNPCERSTASFGFLTVEIANLLLLWVGSEAHTVNGS
jgi:serine/threonine protein kinase